MFNKCVNDQEGRFLGILREQTIAGLIFAEAMLKNQGFRPVGNAWKSS